MCWYKLHVRGEGLIYSLRWSRGYSTTTSAIRVTSSPCPWIKPPMNYLKLTHRIALKCVSLHVSKGEVVEWKLGFGRCPNRVGQWPTVEWALFLLCGGPMGDVECGYARDFVYFSIIICMVSQQSMWCCFSALHLEPTWNQRWTKLGSVFLVLGED
jgi:hypothetical protein